MYWVARMFEGEPLFGKPYPVLVTLVAVGIFTLLVIHALLALRKFPSNEQQYQSINQHMSTFKHGDTWLWAVQVISGFFLLFLASIHLYQLMLNPADIGPYASSDRVWSDRMWPLYIILLFVVEIHGGIGIYRLAIKWGWFLGKNVKESRRRLQKIKWGITVFFLILGCATLQAYMTIGYEHKSKVGERYKPEAVLNQSNDVTNSPNHK
jgi:fumarate reductase subunit C